MLMSSLLVRLRMHCHDSKLHILTSVAQWIQWLRHTRTDPPTIQEQRLDQTRQLQLKQLAAEADRRWAEKPSFLDPPSKQQPSLDHQTNDPAGYVGQTEPERRQGVSNLSAAPDELQEGAQGQDIKKSRFRGDTKDNRRRSSAFSTTQDAQPDAWAPQTSRRR